MDAPVPEQVEISDSVIFQTLNDEAVLLNLTTQDYYGLDDVGTSMWRVLLEHGNVELAVGSLKSLYDADEDRIRQDLYTLVNDLLRLNLLKSSDYHVGIAET